MVILQAVTAPRDCPCPSGERLIIKSGVRDGPVDVPPGEGFPAELPVVRHPSFALVISLGSHDGGLVCSPAFSGNRVVRMAAIRENRSSHWEMSVTGSRAGAGGRSAPWRSSSTVTSAISMNSMSKIRFITLAGRDAAGLKGPGFFSRASAAGELAKMGGGQAGCAEPGAGLCHWVEPTVGS